MFVQVKGKEFLEFMSVLFRMVYLPCMLPMMQYVIHVLDYKALAATPVIEK